MSGQMTVEAAERAAMSNAVSQTAEQKDIMGQIVTSLNEAESALLTHQDAFIAQLRLQLEQIKQSLAARSVVLVCRHTLYRFVISSWCACEWATLTLNGLCRDCCFCAR